MILLRLVPMMRLFLWVVNENAKSLYRTYIILQFSLWHLFQMLGLIQAKLSKRIESIAMKEIGRPWKLA